MFECIAYFEAQKRDMVNAQSKTAAIGWTMFANMFSGKDGPKMNWVELLPFRIAGVETRERVMLASTEKVLIELVRDDEIPRWAADLARRIPVIREGAEK